MVGSAAISTAGNRHCGGGACLAGCGSALNRAPVRSIRQSRYSPEAGPEALPLYQMNKEKMTSREIAATILSICVARNLDIERVSVWPSQTLGWDASFVAAPALFYAYMTRFESVVIELRAMLELVDEHAAPPNMFSI